MNSEPNPAESSPARPTSASTGRKVLYVIGALACVVFGVVLAGPLRSAAGRAWRAVSPGPSEPDEKAMAQGDAGGGVTLYQSGMHPWIITTEPGNCPICGMKLEPIDAGELTGEVTIDPVVVQNMGVRTAEVVQGPLTQTVRTVGAVEVAEPLVRDVNLRVSGWIQTLAVDYVGAEVQAGDELFEVYSPQLYAAQEEYLLALRGSRDEVLLASARDRLLNFGLTMEQVEAIAEAGRAPRTTPILSPHSGVVLEKHANEGMNVDPGMRVFRIADLSELWVQVTLYEYQLPFIEVGQSAVMTVSGLPGRVYEGQVVFVDPTINPRTRAVQVRLAFDNPDRQLKPGMFADVTLRRTLEDRATLVPREAVIDTGQRSVAFVSLGAGRFEPRTVETGVEAEGGMVQVNAGLEPGERVVVSGQFLLDSEASVRESLARMVRGEPAADQSPAMHAASKTTTAAMPGDIQAHINTAAQAYLAIQGALTRDAVEGVADALDTLGEAAAQLQQSGGEKLQPLASAVRDAAELDASDLDAVREGFGPLSDAVIALLSEAPPTDAVGEGLFVTHCPMVDKDWLQTTTAIRNPYATSMLECGSVERAIPLVESATHDHGAMP